MKTALAFAASLFAFSALGGTASADVLVTTQVVNNSNTCAWVTIYTATALKGWSIEGGANRPRFIKRHEGIILFTSNFAGWDSGLPVEIKVRAEFKKNLDCSGPTIADIWEVNKKVRGPHAILISELTGSPYRVSGPR
jgi:hypothetical protein